MDLDDFMVTTSCLIAETIPLVLAGRRLRQRGPAPVLADSEVLTMEVVGEFLGDDQDQAIFQYFRRYYRQFFPALAHYSSNDRCPPGRHPVGAEGPTLAPARGAGRGRSRQHRRQCADSGLCLRPGSLVSALRGHRQLRPGRINRTSRWCRRSCRPAVARSWRIGMIGRPT